MESDEHMRNFHIFLEQRTIISFIQYNGFLGEGNDDEVFGCLMKYTPKQSGCALSKFSNCSFRACFY
jgi:hypothetical protein